MDLPAKTADYQTSRIAGAAAMTAAPAQIAQRKWFNQNKNI